MAHGRNLAIIDGYIGQTPSISKTTNGTAIANFQIATSERYKDGGGKIVTNTEWHNITAFAGIAEFVVKRAVKGSFVQVTGKLQTRTWDDKQTDAKRERTSIIVKNLELVTTGKKSASTSTEEETSSAVSPIEEDATEIPF
jgi:single-strand DNA-binding protein